MNKEEILAMEADCWLDRMVEEKVFNRSFPSLEEMKENSEKQWLVQPECIHFFGGYDAWKDDEGNFCWKPNGRQYSKEISAAWEVFLKFEFPILEKGFDEGDNDYFVCKIGNHRVIQDTAPLAICKAALLAVMEETK